MSTNETINKVRRAIERHRLIGGDETIIVGVSGGADSLTLLHILNRLSAEYRFTIHIAHLNHQLRGADADADAQFVSEIATAWDLPATVTSFNVLELADKHKLSIEEAARQARYQFLAKVASKVDVARIAVAHNADDQVETVLMHWLRGAGLAGLRGMSPLTDFAGMRICESAKWQTGKAAKRKLWVIRPLLDVSRAEIEEYCAAHGLQPRFDLSNLDTTIYRNRLRHELIPYLEEYNPNIRQVVHRAAQIIRDDYDFLRRASARAWAETVTQETAAHITFDLERWRGLHISLQRSLLREAIRRLRHSLRDINWIHIENALWGLREGEVDTEITLPRGLKLFRDYASFTVGETPPNRDVPLLHTDKIELSIPSAVDLPSSDWQIRAALLPKSELPANWANNSNKWQAFLNSDYVGDRLILRHRQPGERFQPLGLNGHTQQLRDAMNNARIPRELRDLWIVVARSTGEVVWLARARVDERAKVRPETARVVWLKFCKLKAHI